jgi:hypothetical protein
VTSAYVSRSCAVLMLSLLPRLSAADPIAITAGSLHYEGSDPVITFWLNTRRFQASGQAFADGQLRIAFPPLPAMTNGSPDDLSSTMMFPAELEFNGRRPIEASGSWMFRATPSHLTNCRDNEVFSGTVCSAEARFSFAGVLQLAGTPAQSLFGSGSARALFNQASSSGPLYLDYTFLSPTPEPGSGLLVSAIAAFAIVGSRRTTSRWLRARV